MLARFVARLLLAPLGFVCGLIAGFVMLAVMTANAMSDVSRFPEGVAAFGYDMSLSDATLTFLVTPLMIAAPAIAAVLIAEMFSIRSWTYHAAAGAITAALPWWVIPSGIEGPIYSAGQILACGVVGGLTHWLVAGRSSGLAPPAPRVTGRVDRR